MKKPTFFGWYILIVFVLMCLMSLLISCRTQYVPVETVRTEYINRTDTVQKIDTVTNEKETVIREVNKGDSALLAQYGIQMRDNERMLLFLQKELDRERSREREVQHDTTIVNDTIRVPYPVEKQVSGLEKYGDRLLLLLMAVVLIGLIFRRR